MIQGSRYKSILLGFLAVLILVVGPWWLCAFYNKPKYERIRFSYKKYPFHQKQVAYLVNKKSEGLSVCPEDIAIALTDLNDDRNPEVVVISWASGISGMGGCYTGIYSQTKQRLRLLWDHHLTDGNLAKMFHKTNGYHDLLSFVKGNSFSQGKNLKHTLVWMGQEGYDYIKSESMTKQEREMFEDEEL
jgi:hypothetical protein